MTESFTPPDTNVETDEDDGIEVELPTYPGWADEGEQRRAFTLECLAPYASDMQIEAFLKLCARVAGFLETGEIGDGKKASLAVVAKK